MTPSGGSRSRAGGDPTADDAGHDDEAGRDGDGDGELAAMRSVWLAMRDEEPSGRGMAELLAAARTKAEAMAPEPGRWQRWAAALRRPPVLALATVVVLIGGAVLLGRRLGEHKQAAARPELPAGPTAGGFAAGSSAVPAARGKAERVSDPRPVPVAAPAPMHATPRREASDATETSPVSERGSASAGRRSPLAQQCEAAARRGDCAAVRRLIAQITQTDPGYRARVAQDAAFARCLE